MIRSLADTRAHIRCVAFPADALAEAAAITAVTSALVEVPRHTTTAAAARRVIRLLDQIRAHAVRTGGDDFVLSAPLVAMLGRELALVERLGAVVLAGIVERHYGLEQIEDALILNVTQDVNAPNQVVDGEAQPGRLILLTVRDRYLPISSRAVAGKAHAVYALMPPREREPLLTL